MIQNEQNRALYTNYWRSYYWALTWPARDKKMFLKKLTVFVSEQESIPLKDNLASKSFCYIYEEGKKATKILLNSFYI